MQETTHIYIYIFTYIHTRASRSSNMKHAMGERNGDPYKSRKNQNKSGSRVESKVEATPLIWRSDWPLIGVLTGIWMSVSSTIVKEGEGGNGTHLCLTGEWAMTTIRIGEFRKTLPRLQDMSGMSTEKAEEQTCQPVEKKKCTET